MMTTINKPIVANNYGIVPLSAVIPMNYQRIGFSNGSTSPDGSRTM